MVLRAFQRKGSRGRDRAAGPAVLRTAEAGFARLPRLRRGGLRPYPRPLHKPSALRPLHRPRKKASHKTLDIRSRGVIE